MSDYGCCTLSVCVHLYEDDDYTCDECPFYDPEFFRKEAEIGNSYQMEKA